MQSLMTLQRRPTAQAGHKLPPQSTSVSLPFIILSLQLALPLAPLAPPLPAPRPPVAALAPARPAAPARPPAPAMPVVAGILLPAPACACETLPPAPPLPLLAPAAPPCPTVSPRAPLLWVVFALPGAPAAQPTTSHATHPTHCRVRVPTGGSIARNGYSAPGSCTYMNIQVFLGFMRSFRGPEPVCYSPDR
jgi:hypothetical protein